MGNEFFDALNSLTQKTNLSEEELKDFTPLIANRYICFNGMEKEADFLNKFTFTFSDDKYIWYLVAKKTLPCSKVFWKYYKKPKKEEDVFMNDIKKYFKVNTLRAKEYFQILPPHKRFELARKFGYTEKKLKQLGFKEFLKPVIKKKEVKVAEKLSNWW